MKKKIYFMLPILVLILSLIIIIQYLRPDNKVNTSEDLTPTESINSQLSVAQTSNKNQNYSITASTMKSKNNLTQKRSEKIDELDNFFESKPKSDQEIIKKLNESLLLNPIEISLNIIPYLNNQNENIQVLALAALENAMGRTEDELKDPSFIDHRNEELRTNISAEINKALESNSSSDFFQKVISVYDYTNPSKQDTTEMINKVYQNNKNKIPSDVELYYLKYSFEKYPELKTNRLQSYEYNEINNKLN